jgi:hypothetical protein
VALLVVVSLVVMVVFSLSEKSAAALGVTAAPVRTLLNVRASGRPGQFRRNLAR